MRGPIGAITCMSLRRRYSANVEQSDQERPLFIR